MPKRGQVIVDDYLRRIVSGELAEGALLPTETAMIEHYGVSRTAVREAVQTLAHKGFVRIRQGSGSTVAPQSSWNLLDPDYLAITGFGAGLASDLVQASDILEPAIAGIAATSASPEQINRMQALVTAMSDTRDSATLAELENAFHIALAQSSSNLVLQSLLNSVLALAETNHNAEAPKAGDLAQAATWSQHVIDAIASRDPEAARDAMRMHLRKLHRGATEN